MNRIIRNSLTSLLLFMSFFGARAQYEGLASQFMFVPEMYNPASVAANSKVNAIGFYRAQWMGMENAPNSYFFAVNGPLKFLKHDHGVGLKFVDDEAGMFSTQEVELQYAFKYRLTAGTLSFGLNAGLINQKILSDNLRLLEGLDEYHQGSDPLIPQSEVNDMAFDFAVGAMFRSSDWYVGISAVHLTKPRFELDEHISSQIGRSAFLTGGYSYPLTNNRFVLNGEGMLRTDFASWQMDIDATLDVDERYYVGLGWRVMDAVIFMAGLDILNGLKLGYSFDLATNRLITKTYGAHEVYVRYEFLLGKKNKNLHRSVRIL